MNHERPHPPKRWASTASVTSIGVALAVASWLAVEACAISVAPSRIQEPAGAPPSASAPPEPGLGGVRPGRATGKLNARSVVGYNLDFPGDWSGLVPFIDLMKNARAWSGSCEDESGCDGAKHLDLDERGWLRSLRYKDRPEKSYAYVETVVFTRTGQPGFDGEIWIEYEGTGEIDIFNGAIQSRDPERRRVVFRAGDKGPVFLRITASDPRGTGDYLRNIRVFRADQAELLRSGQWFNPDMLAYLAPFGSLRFMDWMDGNQRGLCSGGSEHAQDCYAKPGQCGGGRCVMAGRWSERPRADQAFLLARSQYLDPRAPERGVRVGGYPVEVLVALANAAGADPHFNLPATAEDEYAREFATYVKEHLAPNLRASLEYSNETWNWGFPQANYVNEKGRQLWPDEGSAWVQYAGSRMQHFCRMWKEVFGAEAERVRCLISPQTGWFEMAKAMLDCPAWAAAHPELGPCHRGADALAITGYFAGCLQEPQNEPKLRAWLARGEKYALDQFFEQLGKGGKLDCAEEGQGNSLVDTLKLYRDFAGLAKARGLDLYVYESGTHFNYDGKDPAIERLFVAATRDPRMAELYTQNLEGFQQAGGTIINAWGWIAGDDMWANSEHVNDRAHPKYRALHDFSQQKPCSWARCDRSAR